MADASVELRRAAADIPLTRDARDVLERAGSLAAARQSPQTAAVDVLRAILEMRGSLASESLRALGVDTSALSAALAADGAGASPALRQLLISASREAQVLGHYQVDSIHLLLAMLYSDSPSTASALQKSGVTMYDLRRQLQTGASAGIAPPGGTGARPDRPLRKRPLPPLRGVLSISPIFMAIVGATAASGALLWFGAAPGLAGILTIVFVTAGWIVSLCVHEFCHALVAYLGGDRAVATSGYLTLDPLRYTNVLLSLVMPIIFLLLGGIGLPGGAVYINHSALRSKKWDSAVSAAGPAGTVLCGLLVAIPFMWPGHQYWITVANVDFFGALAFLGFIEAVAVILNLIPVPGLDGFGIIRPWLPYSAQAMAMQYGTMAMMGVFVVLWFVAPVRDVFFTTVLQLTSIVQIDPALIFYGQAHMRLR